MEGKKKRGAHLGGEIGEMIDSWERGAGSGIGTSGREAPVPP